MNAIFAAAGATITRSMMPWLLLGCVLALCGAGGAGMYAGYEIANARYASEKLELKNQYIALLEARTKQYLEAVNRGDQVANEFLGALRNLKITNTTVNNEVQREIEKQIYIDCKVPESGVELLRRRINEVNKGMEAKK